MTDRGPVTLADLVTLSGYGLGLWWASGGPAWAALASIAADEVDGALARGMGTAGVQGAALDWGADIALTPLALARLGQEIQQPGLALAAAPLALAWQARMLSQGISPPVGSFRALVMVVTLLLQAQRVRATRPNPSTRRLGPPSRRRSR